MHFNLYFIRMAGDIYAYEALMRPKNIGVMDLIESSG